MEQRKDGIVVRQPNKQDFDSIFELRGKVLNAPVGCPHQTMLSEDDARAGVIHMAAFYEETIVSTVRLIPSPEYGNDTYLVQRMATDPGYQRRGIGAGVLTEAELIAKEKGARLIVLHSRMGAVAFYQSMGYVSTGRTKTYNGDENLEMKKEV